ncbi:MAG: hypothetical protein KAG19_06805 [Methylococcales bacterium]|nr:hypothetical protein [Methylococcales bacterium]
MSRQLISGLAGGLTLLYPVVVYMGIQSLGVDNFAPWKMALVLLFIISIKSLMTKKRTLDNQLLFWVGLAYCLFAIWDNDMVTLRFYPVLMSAGLFAVFFSSLFYPPPIIERFARLQHPNLPEQGIRYTRKVTQVWCFFFILNGCIATITAIWSSFAWWSLYNGFIAYLLMGLLMAVEYIVRIKTQDHVH